MQMNQQPGGMNNMSNPMMQGMMQMPPQGMPMGGMPAAMGPQPGMMMPGASRGGQRSLDDSTLFVGNLPKHLNEERLFPLFASHGNVVSTRILKDSYTGDSRGFGFVTFQNKNNAKNALESTRWMEIDGSVITVGWKNDKPKNFPPGSNLYIANLAPEVTERELFEALESFPELVSVFIKRRDGMSCGYGYAQYRTVEAASRCINGANGHMVRGQAIKVETFKKRAARGGVATKNNLYVRGFSGDVAKSEESINQYIDKVFGTFGKIVSKKANFSEKHNAYCAFVAFEDHKNAEAAFNELKNEEIDGQNLNVVYALTKEQRAKEFQKSRSGKNETNFIVKSLKTEVTEAKLAEIFSRFGKVISTSVRNHEFKNNGATPAGEEAAKEKVTMGMGFVSFATADEARNCFTNAKNDEEVLALLHPNHRANAEFLCYHQPKVMRNKYNSLRRKNSATVNFYQKFMQNMLRQFAAMNGGNNRRGPRGRNGPNPADLMKMQQQQMMMMSMMRNPMMGGMQNPQMNMQAQQQAMMAQQQMAPQQPQQQQQMQVPNDVSWLKNNLDEFRNMDGQRQKTILGTQMYSQVSKLAPGPHVPKITGMLIDQEVLGITEIAEILSNEELLKERIDEAIKIIEEDNGKDQQ